MSSISNAIVSMADLPRQIELDFEANVTMYVKGPAGVGKSTFFHDYAMRQKAKGPFFYGVLNASTAVLPDVIGYMFPTQETYGDKTFTSGTYTYPYFFRDDVTGEPAFMFEQGMLVVDEYDKGQGDVKRALAIIQEEKRIGAHRLPAGIRIVLLGNRDEDRSGSSKDFDFIINRRGEYELRPDMEAWLAWAIDNNVTPVTQAFAARNPEIVFSGKAPEKQGPWPTPRSLVKADEFIKAAERLGVSSDDPTYQPGIASKIGASAAAQLAAFVRLQHTLPKFSAIMASPDGTAVPDAPDAMMILSYELAHRGNKDNIATIVAYMQRLPQAFGVAFAKVLLKRDPNLISTKTMGDWARANSQLLAAVS